jgi:hypothetical protein
LEDFKQHTVSKDVRIRLAQENWDEYVSRLTTMSDKKLSKKLDVIHMQAEIAFKSKNTTSLELLEIWRRQIIEARILKDEKKIPDTPDEIENF